MKIQWKRLILCIFIPLAVGALSSLFTRNSMSVFESLRKPPLSPPGWLFPVVWTILFVLMGIASYLVLTSEQEPFRIRTALYLYGIQLAVNFFWPVFFFALQEYLFAFLWLILLWVLIVITCRLFLRIRKAAGYLLLPYLLWTLFAGYLNLSIYLLN